MKSYALTRFAGSLLACAVFIWVDGADGAPAIPAVGLAARVGSTPIAFLAYACVAVTAVSWIIANISKGLAFSVSLPNIWFVINFTIASALIYIHAFVAEYRLPGCPSACIEFHNFTGFGTLIVLFLTGCAAVVPSLLVASALGYRRGFPGISDRFQRAFDHFHAGILFFSIGHQYLGFPLAIASSQ